MTKKPSRLDIINQVSQQLKDFKSSDPVFKDPARLENYIIQRVGEISPTTKTTKPLLDKIMQEFNSTTQSAKEFASGAPDSRPLREPKGFTRAAPKDLETPFRVLKQENLPVKLDRFKDSTNDMAIKDLASQRSAFDKATVAAQDLSSVDVGDASGRNIPRGVKRASSVAMSTRGADGNLLYPPATAEQLLNQPNRATVDMFEPDKNSFKEYIKADREAKKILSLEAKREAAILKNKTAKINKSIFDTDAETNDIMNKIKEAKAAPKAAAASTAGGSTAGVAQEAAATESGLGAATAKAEQQMASGAAATSKQDAVVKGISKFAANNPGIFKLIKGAGIAATVGKTGYDLMQDDANYLKILAGDLGGGWAGAELGGSAGAAAGSLLGPVGTIGGGILGAVGGSILGSGAANQLIDYLAEKKAPAKEAVNTTGEVNPEDELRKQAIRELMAEQVGASSGGRQKKYDDFTPTSAANQGSSDELVKQYQERLARIQAR